MRRLLGILREDEPEGELAPHPGIDALEGLVGRLGSAGVPVDLHIEGQSPDGLPAGVGLSAYRIVQEALTNVLKHAGPARAEVVIRYEPDAVEVEILDNGRGAAANGEGRGHGLLGMRERPW
jgi:signal transduction histidine kinase